MHYRIPTIPYLQYYEIIDTANKFKYDSPVYILATERRCRLSLSHTVHTTHVIDSTHFNIIQEVRDSNVLILLLQRNTFFHAIIKVFERKLLIHKCLRFLGKQERETIKI